MNKKMFNENLKPVVRFAPSPTGFLHIGGARTALFNWLFARHHDGKFLLRIEDTDRARSSEKAVKAIFESLAWLGLNPDEEPVFQFEKASRHKEVAENLVSLGKAYYCDCPPKTFEHKNNFSFDKKSQDEFSVCNCKNKNLSKNMQTVIRLISSNEGEIIINDLVQEEVKIKNSQLDDMVLLRSDGTPTYMLSVVVDDHDMGITHVIRGTDHLTNTFRQHNLYLACGWSPPKFAHIPLIYGEDGTKLSKRHGAISTEEYQKMGILSGAMRNYLLRLGWGYENEEIIKTEKAIELFDLKHVGKSPARFDMTKLLHLNSWYLRNSENETVLNYLKPFLISEIFQNIIFNNKIKKNNLYDKQKFIDCDLSKNILSDELEKTNNLNFFYDLFDFSNFFSEKINNIFQKYFLKQNEIDLNVLDIIKILKNIEKNYDHENEIDYDKSYGSDLFLLFIEILNSNEFNFGFKNVINGILGLKERAKNLNELAKNSLFYFKTPNLSSNHFLKNNSKTLFENFEIYKKILENFLKIFKNFSQKSEDEMIEISKAESEKISIKLAKFVEPIRIAVTGEKISPSIFNIIKILSEEEIEKRIKLFLNYLKNFESN